MVLLFPICGSLAKMMMTCTQILKRHTDVRVGILTEILQGIRVIKLNAWEDSFIEKVGQVREDEMNVTKSLAIYKAINTFFLLSLPVFVSITTFTVYTATGNIVQANVVFPAIALFATLRFPLAFLPMIIAGVAKMNVARTRITKFLIADEIEDELANDRNRPDGAMVGINNGTFYWVSEMEESKDLEVQESGKEKKRGRGKGKRKRVSKADEGGMESRDRIMPVADGSKQRIESSDFGKVDIDSVEDIQDSIVSKFEPTNRTQHGFELRALNVQIQPGELFAVVGAVGSGKSSFLAALIGDMTCADGDVYVNGSVAYAAQQAWILNGTLKDNVVFGKDFNQERYDQTIESCALRRDLEILSGGDQVEIGERGINLSGGQKQRISVARAVYNDADIVLLDDPLSAVDAHVGKHMFEKAIVQQMAGKTRVLVTNQLHVLPHCDRVCVFKNNTIAELGVSVVWVGYESVLRMGRVCVYKNNTITELSVSCGVVWVG
ncbi:hypothetical protein SARC_05531 [Sphaeroforma arctica JP610]|uniref:ABC transporter domain-containing protein n=1 Tax=Sphaeroforma arctica JP610 TaxID=667725 RepID=A0A0L0G1V6_9EUKA|nr:hypothetical protein SARC_05531 [Sphaeroforma arctica JP610]KNC82173.1 hypothetical protein SARC_05531 [Sphaeroforma arctica JP610]|eukprot:XP_014156075.1 hypothetical protein SARC_05531 [Sphaeroforma arctica JP610]